MDPKRKKPITGSSPAVAKASSSLKAAVKLLPYALALIFPFLLVAPLEILSITYALLLFVAILVAIILLDARSNRILFSMSLRNVIRRPATTALVIGGLMVGTAIISASFVVGDTMDNMITDQVTGGMGKVDFVLQAEKVGTVQYFNQSEMDALSYNISTISHVRAVDTLLLSSIAIFDNQSKLSSPSVVLIGVDSVTVADFGGYVDVNGAKMIRAPDMGMVIINEKTAKALGAKVGDQVFLYHKNISTPATIQSVVTSESLGGYASGSNVFMNLTYAQVVTGLDSRVNMMFVSIESKGSDAFAYSSQVRSDINQTINATMPGTDMKIVADKKSDLDSGRSSLSQFTSMFFVLGSFSIIAGVALIVNIFTMLGEERKSEMGMSRAIGMSRAHLRKMFIYEGVVYACMAAAVGMLMGLLMANIIVIAISGMPMFSEINLSKYFTFTPFSLAISFSIGFIITIVTIYVVTRRISNLNIVRAVRNIPEPPVSTRDKRTFRTGLAMFIGGLLVMILGMSGKNLSIAMSGLSFITISLGLLLRRYLGDRPAWLIAGVLTLFIWLPLGDFKIFDYPSSIEMMVVSGLFMVTASLLIVMFNSNLFVSLFTKLFRFKNGYRAVIKTSISYPLKAHFKTGISIFIFAIVIFTITTLSMMSGILGVGVPKMVEETSGGFDVIAFSGPIAGDPWAVINGTSGPVQSQNISKMISLATAQALVGYDKVDTLGNTTHHQFSYMILGVGDSFNKVGKYPLTAWNHSIYASEDDVWAAVQQNGSLVILDGSKYDSGSVTFGMGGSQTSLAIGQSLMIEGQDLSDPTKVTVKNVTVVGFMKQSNLAGVYMSAAEFNDSFHPTGTSLFLISFASGLDTDDQAVLLKQQFLIYGMQTISIKTLAKQITNTIDSFMTLFQAFLAMGLIIGVSGLGIITIRSIHERKLEIGMMRAMGYTRRMVVMNFAIESAFISLLGISIGTVLGIIVGYQIWNMGMRSMGMDFVIAWVPVIGIGVIAFLATIACVIPAARGASKVSPAEVLRFE